MSRGHNSKDIAKLAISGVEKAAAEFSRMSDGLWLNSAPEYFVTTHVAQALHSKLEKKTILLEYSVNEALKESGSTKPGKSKKELRRNGRFDILLTRRNYDPWCALEVKSPVWTSTKCIQDMKRLRETLEHRKHNSTLRCGAMVFYSDWAKPQKKHQTVEDAVEAFDERFEVNLLKFFPKTSGFTYTLEKGKIRKGKSGDAWRAYCLFVEMRKTRATTNA